ncbi:MAG: YabP/YqfC family sporulation protein [Oscillospiraceae bacterium]|nr:YabP/YqfC family sporulation protein [Oscillospiraceae bacterium]
MRKDTARFSDFCERLDLPAEAAGAAKLTITDGKQTLVENHRGLLEYGADQIRVSTGRGQIILRGSGLTLGAMSDRELLIRGRLLSAEWE